MELAIKVLTSCAVTAQLICAFVFANAKSRFSHYTARLFGITSAEQLTFLPSCERALTL